MQSQIEPQVCFLNGRLVPRSEARISIWDRGFQSGDAVYEGLRVYRGGVFQLHEHVRRLFLCARAIGIRMSLTERDVAKAILDTVAANRIEEDAHVRITVSRGDPLSSGMDTRICANVEPTVAILVEGKKPQMPKSGIRLATSSVRRTPAQCLDPKLHTCNQLGQILAKIEANNAGADEALMLDTDGFVAETNSANIFIIQGDILSTPRADSIMPGCTRQLVFDLAIERDLRVRETRVSLGDVYMADEMFITGTVNQIVPVIEVDGRAIGTGKAGPHTGALLERYLQEAEKLTVTAVA